MTDKQIALMSRAAFTPATVIVPILGITDSGSFKFLGTSSFVGPNGLLLTAQHVIRDWPGRLHVVDINDLSKSYVATRLEEDARHDLALLRVAAYPPVVPLVPLFDQQPSPIRQISTLEYGTTEFAGRSISFNPATRVGNITRQFVEYPLLGPAGVGAWELSFPALKGASGAPVVELGTNGFYGVVVANVSREFLPTQIESVLTDDNQHLEEIKFMMPLGVAVDVKHLRQMYMRHF